MPPTWSWTTIYVHLYMTVEVYMWTTLVMYLLCGHWVCHFPEQQHWATFRGQRIIQRCEMFHDHPWIPHSTGFTGKHRGDRWCTATIRDGQYVPLWVTNYEHWRKYHWKSSGLMKSHQRLQHTSPNNQCKHTAACKQSIITAKTTNVLAGTSLSLQHFVHSLY